MQQKPARPRGAFLAGPAVRSIQRSGVSAAAALHRQGLVVTVSIGLAAILLLATAWLVHKNQQAAAHYDALSDQVDDARNAVDTLLSTLKDAEIGERGYLLTGEPTYLEPYRAASVRLAADLTGLAAVALDDPAREQQVGRIRELARSVMAELGRTIALHRSGHPDLALDEVRADVAGRGMDLIRAATGVLQKGADAGLAGLLPHIRSLRRRSETTGLGALAVGLLGWTFLVRRKARRLVSASRAGLEQFTHAFGLAPGFLRSVDGRIIFWSAGAEALYGHRPHEAVGRNSQDLLHTRFTASLREVEAALQRTGHWEGELTQQRRDGMRMTIASAWTLHRNDAGEPDIIIEINHDVTALKQTELALREHEVQLRLALDASGQGVWHWDIGDDAGEMRWDARCKALFGVGPDAPVDYARWTASLNAEDRLVSEAAITRALDPANPDDRYACTHRVTRPDGQQVWLAAQGRAMFEPDPAAPAGRRAACIMGTIRDDTAARQAEQARLQAAALLHTIIETAPAMIYAKDRQGRLLLANAPVLALLGKTWSEMEGRSDAELLHDPAQGRAVMENDRRIMQQGRIERLEEHVDRPALPRRTWLSTKAPMHAANGEVIGLVGVSVDITEHKRLEDRQRLMINELNHRVKNTLATVQAITARTLRGIDPAIRRTLEDRFLAIASAHDVLTHEKWEGAGLHDVAAAVLAPFGYPDPDRIGVRGPALMLRPGAALALAMGLHELATNALKYGAWSTASGRVELTWDITHDTARQIRLAWQERSGPPVVPPLSRGFGTRLLERSLAQDLGGSVRIGFDDPAGVSCLIEAPLAEVAATDAKDFALAGQC